MQKISVITSMQFDEKKTSWLNTLIQSNLLADETGFLQWGIAEETEFTSVKIDPPAPSRMSQWPTLENPDKQYKIISSWVTLDLD